MNVKTVKTNLRLALILALLINIPLANAFKIDTHVWLTSELWDEINEADDGNLTIRNMPGSYPLEGALKEVILTNRGAFIMGVLGADIYPDMVAGQMTTHPGVNEEMGWQTDDWLKFVRDKANDSGDPAAIAFAYGYMLHAAMDVWAHTYVNTYAGDIFSITENQEVAERHIAIESYFKSLHKTLLTKADGSNNSKSSAKARQEIGRTLLNPGRLARKKQDALSGMRVPSRFVAETLILNPDVAQQYELGGVTTAHLKGMHDYWTQVKKLPELATPLRSRLNQRYSQFVGLVAEADALFQTTQTAYDAAIISAAATTEDLAAAEQSITNATYSLVNEALWFLGYGAKFWDDATVVQEARKLIEGNTIAAILIGPLVNVEKTLSDAEAVFAEAKRLHDEATEALADLQEETLQAAQALELKEQALALLDAGRQAANQISDAALNQWRENIEAAVEAYIVAWEETARELMRPSGGRFSEGNDPTGPLKRWAICWGPALGMVAHPALQSSCVNTIYDYSVIVEQINLLPRQALLPENIRDAIETFDHEVQQAIAIQLTTLAGAMASPLQITEDANASGFAVTLIRLWDKETTATDLDLTYSDDLSGKNLIQYTEMHKHVLNDIGLLPGDPRLGALTLEDLSNFAPVQNALTLSKLTLLGGDQLNRLGTFATTPNVKTTPKKVSDIYKNHIPTPRIPIQPLYNPKSPAGEVLIGAIRSIDGNHQWLATAPDLPRANGENSEACRRFGYPEEGGEYQDSNCPDDLISQPVTKKGGFRFWQNTKLRETVFKKIFIGPVALSLCEATGQFDLPDRGLACGKGSTFIDF